MKPSRLARFRGSLRVVIAGAGTLWVAHFALVYLVAEWQCRPNRPREALRVAGVDITTAITLAATLTIGAAIVLLTWAVLGGGEGRHLDPGTAGGRRGELALTAWVLAAIFVIATVAVGILPLFLGTCS